jgi:hypothetical protein
VCSLFGRASARELALLPSSPCHACFTSPIYAVAKAKGGAQMGLILKIMNIFASIENLISSLED